MSSVGDVQLRCGHSINMMEHFPIASNNLENYVTSGTYGAADVSHN